MEDISGPQSDDQPIQGYLGASDASASGIGGPGILVLHAWWGLNEFFKGLCDRLAQEGFVAFAPDLYAGKVAETVDQAKEYMSALSTDDVLSQIQEAAGYLRKNPLVTSDGIGVIGFSLGAFLALSLSTLRPDDIKAVVIYYGTAPGDFTGAKAAYQGHFAEQDDFEPEEGVRALQDSLRKAGKKVTFYEYMQTGHWFFEENQPEAYHPEAAARAWERTLAFLRKTLTSARSLEEQL